MPFAEEDGGFGGGAVETMLIMEAFGRALALEPYLATVVLAGGLVKRAASAEQRAALIPQIAAGDLRLAFAHSERQSGWDLFDVAASARKDGAGYVLNGEKGLVLHGDSAHKLIVSARSAGGRRERGGARPVPRRRVRVRPRAARLCHAGRAARGGNHADQRARRDATTSSAIPRARRRSIERVVDEAIAALCAEAVGAMSEALEITVDYLKTRKQFGVAIGSFQALQHRAADMVVALEQARSMMMLATMMAGDDDAAAARQGDLGGQGADRPLRQVHRPAGDAIARRHRDDLRIQARPSLQAHDDDRHDLRRCGCAFAAPERSG